jgi:hypothetical protein
LGCHHHPLPQQPELHSLRYYAVGDEVPLGRFVRRTLLRQLVQELLKSGPEFPVLAEGQRRPAASGFIPPSSLSCRCRGPTAGAATFNISSSRSTACSGLLQSNLSPILAKSLFLTISLQLQSQAGT